MFWRAELCGVVVVEVEMEMKDAVSLGCGK